MLAHIVRQAPGLRRFPVRPRRTRLSNRPSKSTGFPRAVLALPLAAAICVLCGCSAEGSAKAGGDSPQPALTTVGTVALTRKPIFRQLTVSSELVPFQEIDIYAKESGYVKQLLVDYGTRVKQNQLLAVLEIPELEVQLQQDEAAIDNEREMVTHAQHEQSRVEAQRNVSHLQYTRLKNVADKTPGLVAQQEVDDWQGKDLAAEAQVEAAQSALQSAQSQLLQAQAKLQHDKVLFEYSKLYAPFNGVVTQRYANQGTLVQAGTSSSTQVIPIVKLSEDDLFRLVIPVPESSVRFVRLGSKVQVRVPSLDKIVSGTVARFSVDVAADTRTMHTEVDVPNPGRALMPGMYAEATLTLEGRNDALVVPLTAVDQGNGHASVLLVDGNNRLEERQIAIGLQASNDAEVLSGLTAGDRVVVSDRSGLKPGIAVQPHPVQGLEYETGKEQQ
ncbi:MAG: efflux RND transporter periplasmic adaptor subunit [Bryobacteraceae bacterium]|jgi:RND family efflux transporter MFP subunit